MNEISAKLRTFPLKDTYLDSKIKRAFIFSPIVFVSLMSNIIQLTFVLPISIHSFIKIKADAVRFHITLRFTKLLYSDFSYANYMIYQAFPVKGPLWLKLEVTATVFV